MADPSSFDSPSLKRHRKQKFWQIVLPFFLATAFVAAGAALAAFGGGAGQARLWADISLIWLALPALFFALFFLAILIGLIYLLARLSRGVPPVTARVQFFSRRLAHGTRQVADKAVQPLVWLGQVGAMLRTLFGVKGR